VALHMADRATPQNIPDSWNGAVAAYINERYAWPHHQIMRFNQVIRISVTGDPDEAKKARCIDVEQFAATPAEARAFIRERIRLGHHDATVYCSRDRVPEVRRACHGLPFRLWVADWTGQPHRIHGIDAWAVQYHGGPSLPFDTSIIYGEPPRKRHG
jgi:hypothetical protein